MNKGRWSHTATPIPGGVLIAGGQGANGYGSTSAEVYDFSRDKFIPAAAMTQGRFGHTATPLDDGRVLLAGGRGHLSGFPYPFGPTEPDAGINVPDDYEFNVRSAEVYDPGTRTFGLPLATRGAHAYHTATRLLDGNGVLILGGFDAVGAGSRVAEVFNGTTFDATGNEVRGLTDHTATLLPSTGEVLIAGGAGIEIYNPMTRTFTRDRIGARTRHTATLLPTGGVLIAGGMGDDTGRGPTAWGFARIYHPEAKSFTLADIPMVQARVRHTATLLPNGKVLFAGGADTMSVSGVSTASAELYDPDADTFTPTLGSMSVPRASHTATLLPSGEVLITGGDNGSGAASAATDSAEFYDPGTETFTRAEDEGLPGAATRRHMTVRRSSHAATLLPSGKVLISGGDRGSVAGAGSSAAAEFYNPATGEFTLAAFAFAATSAGALGDGDAVLGSEGGTVRIGGDRTALTALTGPPGSFAVVPLVDGDAVIAGSQMLLMRVGIASTLMGAPSLISAVRLASGEFFGFNGGTLRADHRPPGVLAPTITDAPAQIVSGEQPKLTGTRFSSPTAVGAAALSADPTTHLPLVAFMPAAIGSGGPIFGRTISWTDTELTWEVPRTVFAGPGFLHVYVDGVWSDGAYTVLTGEPRAGECRFDGECSTGHCVDGICCDRSCAGGCETCIAAKQAANGTDGTCGPIAPGGSPRFGCDQNESKCTPTGTCDGTGSCTAPQGTPCVSLKGATGSCFGGACVSHCTSAAQCGPGSRCSVDGRCIPAAMPAVATDSGACSVVGGVGSRGAGRPWGLALVVALGAAAGRRKRRDRAGQGNPRVDGTAPGAAAGDLCDRCP